MAGYSIKPLAIKLGIKEGTQVCTVDAPKDYASVLSPLPAGANIKVGASSSSTLVHVFATRRSDLTEKLRTLRKTLSTESTVWVSWPKKSAKVATDITEDVIREVALPLGFVDVKVCAVTAVWSGLKLVVRKELR